MKIVFASNYFNHHEKYFCDELSRMPGVDFTFIQTQEMTPDRIKLGWGINIDKIKYCICSYKSPNEYSKAIDVANNADILLLGSAPYQFVKERIRHNRLTFYIAERLFRNGLWHMLYPPTFITVLKRFIIPGHLSNFYMLCASGYTAGDVHNIYTFNKKCLKWGHFVSTEAPLRESPKDTIRILWAGRMIPWKHPEYATMIATHLKNRGINFHIDIIGTGPLKESLKSNILKHKLTANVNLLDSMPSKDIRQYMANADIYLFTSDFNEGWGAVLGEAMSAGCAVVASHGIGAVPFLVEHGKNGLIYQTGNSKDFERCVDMLIDSENLRTQLGQSAKKTMNELWSPHVAAQRFVQVAKNLLTAGYFSPYESGPLSIAPIIKNNWYRHDSI